MKKVPCLFRKEYEGQRGTIFNEVTPGCEWVLLGEGTPTIKYDGSACLVSDGKLYKRYDCKRGRVAPEGWIPCEDKEDEVTGHWPGWLEVGDEPESKWHKAAFDRHGKYLDNGTYEIIGPHFHNNPYKIHADILVKHGSGYYPKLPPRDFDGLRDSLRTFHGEGIVFHHKDGRMAKIRRKDFGFDWPIIEDL
jgi:hypothetical protein